MKWSSEEEKYLTDKSKNAYNKLKGYADLFKPQLQGFNQINKPISTKDKQEMNIAIQDLIPELLVTSTSQWSYWIDENSKRIKE